MKSTLRDTVALSCKTSTFVEAPTNYFVIFSAKFILPK